MQQIRALHVRMESSPRRNYGEIELRTSMESVATKDGGKNDSVYSASQPSEITLSTLFATRLISPEISQQFNPIWTTKSKSPDFFKYFWMLLNDQKHDFLDKKSKQIFDKLIVCIQSPITKMISIFQDGHLGYFAREVRRFPQMYNMKICHFPQP